MEAAKVYSINKSAADLAREYMTKNNIGVVEFSKRISLSHSTISQYLKGSYNSNPANIERAIYEFLKSEGITGKASERLSPITPQRMSFFPSRDAKNVIAVCQSCQEYMGLGIIVGRSGFGKTYALKQYAKAERVCYIYCDDTMSSRDLIESIEEGLGIPAKYGSINKRVKSIRKFFSVNRGYLLIIDEADKLLNKFTQKKMEILRSIYDPAEKDSEESDVGLVISGEPRLESLIKAYLPRFANRADFNIRLDGLSRKEVEQYLGGYNLTDEALNELTIRATNIQTGCFRLLHKTLRNITRLLGVVDPEELITLDVINKASSMMML